MKQHHISHLPATLQVLALLGTLSGNVIAQNTPITGNLTVTGSVISGTSNSAGGTEFRQNGLIIAKGAYSGDLVPGTLTSGDEAAGTRMVWYPGKAAFRAGRVTGSMWNDSNIGNYSAAFGLNCKATQWNSVAMGSDASAMGYCAVAMGGHASAIGYGAVAIGFYTTADSFSTAFGNNTVALGGGAMAAGSLTTAYGPNSTALGLLTIATGSRSTALGEATSAGSLCSTALGRANIGGGNPYAWIPTDPLFEIGNGSPLVNIEDGPYEEEAAPSNALTVYKNGNMDVQGNIDAGGVITCAPGGDIPMFTGN